MKQSCDASSRNDLDIALDARFFQKTPAYLWDFLVDALIIWPCFFASSLYTELHDHFNSCTLQWLFGSDLFLFL